MVLWRQVRQRAQVSDELQIADCTRDATYIANNLPHITVSPRSGGHDAFVSGSTGSRASYRQRHEAHLCVIDGSSHDKPRLLPGRHVVRVRDWSLGSELLRLKQRRALLAAQRVRAFPGVKGTFRRG